MEKREKMKPECKWLTYEKIKLTFPIASSLNFALRIYILSYSSRSKKYFPSLPFQNNSKPWSIKYSIATQAPSIIKSSNNNSNTCLLVWVTLETSWNINIGFPWKVTVFFLLIWNKILSPSPRELKVTIRAWQCSGDVLFTLTLPTAAP